MITTMNAVPCIQPVLTSPSSTLERISIGRSSNKQPQTVGWQVRHQCVCLRLKSLETFNKSTQTHTKTPHRCRNEHVCFVTKKRLSFATPRNRLATIQNTHETHTRGAKPKKGDQCFCYGHSMSLSRWGASPMSSSRFLKIMSMMSVLSPPAKQASLDPRRA